MKKNIVFIFCAAGLLFAACGKDHQCKCFKTDNPDDVNESEMIFYLDGSTACEDIKEMAFEEHVATEGVNSLHRVDVHPVNCRDYGE